MSRRASIRKLNLGPSVPITMKNSTAGMVVIADYLDPTNGQRTLVLERQGEPTPAKRSHKPKVNAKASQGETGPVIAPVGVAQ
jgi:hypothetical protein